MPYEPFDPYRRRSLKRKPNMMPPPPGARPMMASPNAIDSTSPDEPIVNPPSMLRPGEESIDPESSFGIPYPMPRISPQIRPREVGEPSSALLADEPTVMAEADRFTPAGGFGSPYLGMPPSPVAPRFKPPDPMGWKKALAGIGLSAAAGLTGQGAQTADAYFHEPYRRAETNYARELGQFRDQKSGWKDLIDGIMDTEEGARSDLIEAQRHEDRLALDRDRLTETQNYHEGLLNQERREPRTPEYDRYLQAYADEFGKEVEELTSEDLMGARSRWNRGTERPLSPTGKTGEQEKAEAEYTYQQRVKKHTTDRDKEIQSLQDRLGVLGYQGKAADEIDQSTMNRYRREAEAISGKYDDLIEAAKREYRSIVGEESELEPTGEPPGNKVPLFDPSTGEFE